MDGLSAAKLGNLTLLKSFLVDPVKSVQVIGFRNPSYAGLDETRTKKPMFCAECYEKVKCRSGEEVMEQFGFVGQLSCDWPKHKRSLLRPKSSGSCCCSKFHGCNWGTCKNCYTEVIYDLKAPFQLYNLQEGYTALIAAASRGHLDCVAELVQHGADLNTADPDGLTALLVAASGGYSQVVDFLMQHGADINCVEKSGMCALSMACEIGSTATAQVLLAHSPDLGWRDKTGAPLLHIAATAGAVDIMELLLEAGSDAREVNEIGDTALHWLAMEASGAAVRLLVANGADVNAVNKAGFSPIALSVMRGSYSVTAALVKAGANMNTVCPWGTVLNVSCILSSRGEITELLLAAGIDHADNNGRSFLVSCANCNNVPSTESALKHGVRGAGEALIVAVHKGFTSVVRVILAHWNEEDADMTKLHLTKALAFAVHLDSVVNVKLLLRQGADASATFSRGVTVVGLAKSNRVRGILRAHLAGTQNDNEAAEEEDEDTAKNTKQHLRNALKKGTKKWGRSKIMLVGDGRAGKTALANSIMGEDFLHTESTIGIHQMTCDVKHVEVGKEGQWDEHVKPIRELEAALAKIVAARRRKEESEETDEAEDEHDAECGTSTAATGPAQLNVVHKAPENRDSVAAGVVKGKANTNKVDIDFEAPTSIVKGIDDALVMKYLASLNDNTKFVISLFDYGGQSVFNVIHHLFLTRYGVYALVFNMEQLVAPDGSVRESCLSTLSFWLNSILVHTWNAEMETMAPIVIVGTHKDIVKDASDHAQISRILHDKFCSSVAWPFILRNVDTGHVAEGVDVAQSLSFFPVNNRRSRKDTTVMKMMKLIEDVIDKSEYVHTERPLTWLQTMDRLTACGKVFLPLSEVEAIAQECDVPRIAVPSMLSFLHEMGILMWHDDIALRDVVILDPVAYFVTPVTTIICKHLATAADTTRHVMEAHKKCSKLHYDAWMKMVHRGVANADVINTLLQDCGQQTAMVVHLMVKFGLVVPLLAAAPVFGTSGKMRSVEYLVPALLPQLNEAQSAEQDAVAHGEDYVNTCYFVFSCSDALTESSSMLTVTDTANLGFLPRGLFERLICKAVEWCRDTSAVQSLQSQPLFQDAAVLAFGNQRFRMRAFPLLNCIQVDFARGNPLAVHQRLHEQLQQIMDECMKSLRFFTVLPYPVVNAAEALTAANVYNRQLIQLKYVRGLAKEEHTGLHTATGSKLLSDAQVLEHYEDWLVDDFLRGEYDVFISHCWGSLDSRFTDRLRDRFSTYNLGEDNRAVTVFLDNKRLKDGGDVVDEFACALVNSLIVVPVLSSEALQRMMNHNPAQKDDVLLEWVVALECLHSPHSRVSQVLPILFGQRDSSSSDVIGNLYAEGTFDLLPDTRPEETLQCAIRLLRANGVEPRPEIASYTVRGIVEQLKVIQGYCAWTAPEPCAVVAEATRRVVVSLQEVLGEVGTKMGQPVMLN